MAQDKKIEDYLHLYLGCEVQSNEGEKGVLEGIRSHSYYIKFGSGEYNSEIRPLDGDEFLLLLRPLSSMTEEEAQELATMLVLPIGAKYSHNAHKNNSGQWVVRYGNRAGEFWIIAGKIFNQFQTIYLLSKHFDLFNLHEAGLCLYKTDLK